MTRAFAAVGAEQAARRTLRWQTTWEAVWGATAYAAIVGEFTFVDGRCFV